MFPTTSISQQVTALQTSSQLTYLFIVFAAANSTANLQPGNKKKRHMMKATQLTTAAQQQQRRRRCDGRALLLLMLISLFGVFFLFKTKTTRIFVSRRLTYILLDTAGTTGITLW